MTPRLTARGVGPRLGRSRMGLVEAAGRGAHRSGHGHMLPSPVGYRLSGNHVPHFRQPESTLNLLSDMALGRVETTGIEPATPSLQKAPKVQHPSGRNPLLLRILRQYLPICKLSYLLVEASEQTRKIRRFRGVARKSCGRTAECGAVPPQPYLPCLLPPAATPARP